MISNPNFIYYACIAKGTTILAQYSSKGPEIEELAAECIAKAPFHHSMFSHTVKRRTYTFLIDDPFAYFAILDEELVKSERTWFLNRLKCSLDEIIESRSILKTDSDCFTALCFQAQFDSIFRETMILDLDLADSPPVEENKQSQNRSLDSEKGKRSAMVPLLGNGLKKKKRMVVEANGIDGKDFAIQNKVDLCDDVNGLLSKNNMVNDRQKANKIWKKHVWVVLLLDVFVCAVLFVIWLCVCRGFQCMQS